MDSNNDIRWEQRFANYNRALSKLDVVMKDLDAKSSDDELSDHFSELEMEGVIQRFEYIHELSWKVMKDYLDYQGNTNINGSRDATREAFKIGLIENADLWMEMIGNRNRTVHTYNEGTAREIFSRIIRHYYSEFVTFRHKMETLRTSGQGDLFTKEA